MINIEVDNTNIKFPISWDTLSLPKAIALYTLSKTLPNQVKEVYALCYEEQTEKVLDKKEFLLKQLSHEQTVKTIPKFFGDCIQLLSDSDTKTINKISKNDRYSLYERYIKTSVMGLLNFPDYEIKGIKSFNLGGVEYLLPSIEDGFGVQVPFADGTADEFCQVADLETQSKNLEGGRWEVAALICGILCRPKVSGERVPYDEKEAIKRAELFKELPMSTVLEVFFCFSQLLTTSENLFQISLQEAKKVKEANGLSSTDGVEILPMWQKAEH